MFVMYLRFKYICSTHHITNVIEHIANVTLLTAYYLGDLGMLAIYYYMQHAVHFESKKRSKSF